MAEESKRYDAWHGALEAESGVVDPWYELVKAGLAGWPLQGLRTLEIGCGRGGFACWLGRQPGRPSEIVAMDLSAVAIEKGRELARRSAIEGITWKVGDIQAIDEPDDRFDLVFSCETIEHVPSPQRAIAELARVLRPEGTLFLTVPNYLGIFGLYRAFLRLTGRRFTEVGQPINNFTVLPRVKSWVRRAGLSVVKVEAVGHYVLWPGRRPRRLPQLDRWLPRSLALHSLIVARKPGSS